MNEHNPFDDVVIELSLMIDRAVDGDLNERERAEFDAQLIDSPALQAAYADALAVRQPLVAREADRCPDSVIDGVMARIAERSKPAAVSVTAPRTSRPWWAVVMPFAAAAAVVCLSVWGVSALYSPETVSPTAGVSDATEALDLAGYTEAEQQAAVEEARVAFAIFARSMNESASRVSDDVKSSFTYPVTHGLKEVWEHVPAPFSAHDRDAAKRG